MVARSPNASQSPFFGMPAHLADCKSIKFGCKRVNCCLPPFQCCRLHFVCHIFMPDSTKKSSVRDLENLLVGENQDDETKNS